MKSLQKGSKKLLNAWAFYDWANSVYSLTIASAIFPLFYGALFREAGIEKIEIFGGEIARGPLITYVTSFAFLVVSFLTPLLSGIADYVGNKKVFLKFFCYLGSISSIGLYWFSLDAIYLSLTIYFFGLIGFWGSLVFYNSYLPDVAFPEQQDRISAKGYSLGYIGSVFLLLLNLAMIMKYEWFGFEGAGEPTKISFILVGIWWALFSQYSFYYLPKGNDNTGKISKKVLLNGFRELKKVWNRLGDNLRLKRYLIAFFVYSMAVQTVMLVASYFAEEELAWESDSQRTTGLIISILLIQLVAVAGALLTSRISEKIGNIKTLIAINIIWVIICCYAYFVITPEQFYVTAAFVGLVMGGIQALSRSTYSKFLPETKDTASFFSFYDVAEKIGIVIGMFLYGFMAQITGSMRTSIVLLGLIFLIGVVLLLKVEKSGVGSRKSEGK
ncbi:major facilitator superfamily permease [Galbibacter orientalis DSM 19592]|uniref:Major facilitator superfamily permease n=1 Tax=Galbibacter orientalis DSM 19592 TaxID=926559 RepID=I3C9A4_9FLAO|nr:MFS transporter [Galbibacter orientalis]EIJ40197.1 major facilitator superfamily permease [Galbibacter orientalis DSM 19592]